jgi:hypothetical protein
MAWWQWWNVGIYLGRWQSNVWRCHNCEAWQTNDLHVLSTGKRSFNLQLIDISDAAFGPLCFVSSQLSESGWWMIRSGVVGFRCFWSLVENSPSWRENLQEIAWFA